MKFALPQFLWLLLLVPLAAWLLWWAARQRQRLMAGFIHTRLLESLTAGLSSARRRFRYGCLLAALALLAVAIARPQWGFQWEEVKRRGLDIIVAIDTSRSMLAEDIKPNRLERAKLAALDLAQQARSDRVGLIAFAGSAFLQCPLTLDDEAFRQSVMALDTEIIPQGGTAIAEAINVARNAYTNAGENYKVLVMFSDGEDHEEGVMEAAEAANKDGLKIFAIGLGTPEGEDLRLPEGGRRDLAKDSQGNLVHTKLEERLLDSMAKAAGGFYLRLTGARTIETLYEKGLAPLPKVDYSARLVRQYNERFHWPLGLAILLLMVEILVPDRTMKKRAVTSSAAAGAWMALALSLGMGSAHAVSPGEAQRQLDKGYNKAAKQAYEQLLVKHPDDPRLHYNLGVAAFRDKDYERAAREFNSATLAPENLDLQQRAFYNAGNALFRTGEGSAKPEEKKSAWQSATNQFTSALRLNPKDGDAQHNLEFITKKLQELEQQQQQQQQNQDQNKDQQDQPDQNKDQNQQSKPDQQKDQKDQQQQQQANKDDKKPDQQQTQSQPPDQPKPDQQKAEPSDGQQSQGKSGGDGEKTSAQAATIQLTPEQAKQLLEAAKMEEKVLQFVPPESADKRKRPNHPIKNW